MDGNSPQNQTAAPSRDGVPGEAIVDVATPAPGEPQISISDSTRPTTVPGVPSNLISISQYKALRVAPIAAPANLTPDAPSLAALVADNQHMAVAQMRASLAGGINLAVAPPLTYAVLRSLGSAAFGDSLTQISRNFDLTPTPFVAAQQTARVSSHLWADREKKLRTEFLSATDSLGPLPSLVGWSADEAGFSDGSAANDSAFTRSLSDANGLSLAWFSAQANIRLLMAHTMSATAGWAALVPFDGIFERGTHDLVRLPLVRLTAGVTRHVGSDFTADALVGGDLSLMVLRPSTGTLTDFATTRLETALAEAVLALLSNAVAPMAGEMLLPQVDIALALQADEPLRRSGVTQVYDEVLANLKGLDGVGGTYVQTAAPAATLHIAPDGLSLRAAHALAFTYSPRNINGPNYSSDFLAFTSGSGSYVFGTCVWPAPDLRSFFLVLLDARHWVVSLAAVQAPPGAAVLPICS